MDTSDRFKVKQRSSRVAKCFNHVFQHIRFKHFIEKKNFCLFKLINHFAILVILSIELTQHENKVFYFYPLKQYEQ